MLVSRSPKLCCTNTAFSASEPVTPPSSPIPQLKQLNSSPSSNVYRTHWAIGTTGSPSVKLPSSISVKYESRLWRPNSTTSPEQNTGMPSPSFRRYEPNEKWTPATPPGGRLPYRSKQSAPRPQPDRPLGIPAPL